MKKSGFVLVAIILVLTIVILLMIGIYFKKNKTSNQQVLDEDKFIHYSPPAGSFSVSYPKEWQVRPLGNDGAEFKSPETGSLIAIDTTIGADINRENIDKIVETLQAILEARSSPVSNTILDGRNGKKFEFDAKQPITGEGRVFIICCVNPNPKSSSRLQQFYMLLAINNGEREENEIMQEIINSFEIEPLDWENLYK